LLVPSLLSGSTRTPRLPEALAIAAHYRRRRKSNELLTRAHRMQVTELSRAEKEGRAARNARVIALDEEGNPEGAHTPAADADTLHQLDAQTQLAL